jgi:dTDP-4-dehydrorhamnose reductase
MKKILLLGAAGFLGTNLSKTLKSKFILIKQSRKKIKNFLKFDPKNIKLLKKVIFIHSPDIIINLVAETNVDTCEKNLKIAKSANILINKNLVKIYKNSLKKFFCYIHIN